MKNKCTLVGIIGLVVGLCVLGVSASLPIVVGRAVSWREAALGIVPGAICSAIALVVSLVGLGMAPSEKPEDRTRPRSRRRDRDEDDDYNEDDEDEMPRRRKRRD